MSIKNFRSKALEKAVRRDFPRFENLVQQELQRRHAAKNCSIPKKPKQLSQSERDDLVCSIFLDWVHYKLHFSNTKREVGFSEEFERRVWRPQFDEIIKSLAFGFDLVGRQSRDFWRGDRKPIHFRQDTFFSHFKIAHYHLGNFVDEKGMVYGSEDIMYVYLDATNAVILDVGPHDFSRRNAYRLFGLFADTLPHVADRTEIKGIMGLSEESLSEVLDKPLPNNFVSAFECNGKFYVPPTMGTVGSGHLINAVTCLDEISEWWEENLSTASDITIDVQNSRYVLAVGGAIFAQSSCIM